MKFNYLKRDYEIEEYIFQPSPKKVDIILPVFNEFELFTYCLRSLRKFTDSSLYNLFVLDNGSIHENLLNYIEDMKRFLFSNKNENINIVHNKSIGKEWAGSEAHGLGLNSIIGSGILNSENIFLMHTDSTPLAHHWLNFMLSKINEGNTAVGTYTNWEKDNIKFLHCSGLLINRNFVVKNDVNCCPNKPEYDTIGDITLKLIEKEKKYFVMKNSRNNPELRQYHAYNHERGSESFDDKLTPVWAHEGRGSQYGDRGGWIREL